MAAAAATATTANGTKMSLKLMVHKDEKRVIFAEADANFVDTLFSFMTLPLGTIVRLLEQKFPDEKVKALGSVRNLYKSLLDLPETYFSARESKFMLLNPRSSSYDQCRKLKLNIDDTEPIKYFTCQNSASFLLGAALECPGSDQINQRPVCSLSVANAKFSTCNLARCGSCRNPMNRQIKYDNVIANSGGCCDDGGLFVTNVTSVIVTDDLRVMPNTSGFTIQVLFDFGIIDASQLEEMTFDIGPEQILILLKGLLLHKYPLTYLVFNSFSCFRYQMKQRQVTCIQHITRNEIDVLPKTLKLKLTLRKSNSKLLFAEADVDFIDFLLGLLEIPLGTVMGKLINGNSSLESLDNLFASISNLNVGYVKPQVLKDVLLQPKLSWNHVSQNKNFCLDVSKPSEIFFHFSEFGRYFAELTSHKVDCLKYGERCEALTYKNPRVHGGILKPPAKFMLTDDLVLTPMSSISIVALLNKFEVPPYDVEECEVSIGIEEGLKILKASLKSLTPLTDALL